MRLRVTFASAVSLPKMFSIPDVVPVPSSVMVSLPSTVTGGNVAMTFIAEVIAILCAPAPQLKVTVPPVASCACSADCVQDVGVPLPTTPAVSEVDVARTTTVNSRTTDRLMTHRLRKLKLLQFDCVR